MISISAVPASDTEMVESGESSANAGMLMPYPHSGQASVPVRAGGGTAGTAVAEAGAAGALAVRRSYDHPANRKRPMDNVINTEHGGNEIIIDESILSLLLKLHSQLSGSLDSFSLCDESYSEEAESSAEASVEEGGGKKTAESGGNVTGENKSGCSMMEVEQSSNATPKDEPMEFVDFFKECAPGMDNSSSDDIDPSITAALERQRQLRMKKYKVSDSRFGDGPFFIGNLLRKIARLDELCAQSIEEIRERLWPNQRERQAEQKVREAVEKEERRKRARERQMKMMQDFANKQKQFMQAANAANNLETGMEDEEELYEEQPREKEYDCIICNCTTPSTDTNPIGLIVLVESSGIVGHRRRNIERLSLPLSFETDERLKNSVRLACEYQRRTDLLSSKYGEESWYLSNNMAYENGVHVQSCGHHVHLSCLDAYLKTLYATQRQHLHERGEFYCPVCRQLSNSVLPLSPQLDRPIPMVRRGTQTFQFLANELTTLIRENERPPVSKTLLLLLL